MSDFELVSFTSAADLAKAAASEWLKKLSAVIPGRSVFCVALSGGRIARQFFSAVVDLAKPTRPFFQTVHFFWADERCVPPADPESNFAIARDLLFSPLNFSENQIHRIRGEDSPEAAATQAEADLCRLAPLNPDSQPLLDLIFLGMGEDGHVASLFPHEPEEMLRNRAIYRAVTAAKPPPRRITLGYQTIAVAREVWILASGPGKEQALRDSIAGPRSTPLGRVISLRERTKIFTDIRLQ